MKVDTKPGPPVTLPDISIITATQQGQLPQSKKLLTQSNKLAVLNKLHS